MQQAEDCQVGPAAERNYGYCTQHRVGWWPKTAQVGVGGRQVAEAGCAWLGPGFMRSDERRNLCDCGMAGWRAASASATSAEVYARGGVGAGQPFQIQTPNGQVAPPPPA